MRLTEVLIETYWNVNCAAGQRNVIRSLVLIETYWNVNIYPLMLFTKCSACINRNILECKFVSAASVAADASVLIETYWNVNCISTVTLYRQHGY